MSEDAKFLLERKGLMIRNTYDFDTKEKTSFWNIKLPFLNIKVKTAAAVAGAGLCAG